MTIPTQRIREALPLKFTTTARGFRLIEFKDYYEVPCSLQQSSLASQDAIWLGASDADPRILASQAKAMGLPHGDGTGWVPYPMPEDVLTNTRMHLTREQVAGLLPLLQQFVETGTIPINPPGGSANA